MKTKFIIILAVLMGGGSLFLCPLNGDPEVRSKWDISVPAPALDLGDLDARDHLNRPITSALAQRNLESLFVESLSEMLLFNLTPRARDFLVKSAQQWDTLFGFICRGFAGAGSAVFSFIRDKKNKFILSLVFINQHPLNCAQGEWYKNNARCSFQFLVSFILSSTTLLR